MDRVNLLILQFLKEDLEKTEAWTFHYVIEEALGLSPMVVDISLTQLEQEKMITRCLCGCNGIMIAPAGYDVLPKPEKQEQILVWKTQEGNVVRITHMSDEHLRNAIIWLLKDSSLTDEYEGVSITQWVKEMSAELHSRMDKNG
ncbi:hypothetical protein GAP31_247 [Cronobacter phage vB_CsaM_GAP31]|uniref:Uncharacterized protein n=1 Tax=Cronobacter phage vB_CsaM_GAP31 TaxID=1141135 RepID=K4F6A4_9CAUD|nr:hypothetical protein GAP31_247 [Cronobacter phage vB_CsaM_GAP31]AFC21428.1 hypothetical protein GAP31_247 [Cronobacter phage vB_CsaM_GAP31]